MERKGKMNSKSIVSILMISLMLSVFPAALATVDVDVTPRLDDIYFKISYPEDTAMELARACELDTMTGMINPDNVRELEGTPYEWSVSMNPGFHMCYLGINCRDVTPPESGMYYDYHNRTAGFPLYPLNLSDFRLALHYMIGCKKTARIAEQYEFVNVRLDVNVPPASVYWYNDDIPPYPYDPTEAYNLLIGLGFDNSTGYWVTPKGGEMRQMYVIAPVEAPPSVALTHWCVDQLNAFFGKMSDTTSDYFLYDDINFYPEIDVCFGNRDHDIYFLCWGLGRDPDHLWWFFHPEVDVPYWNNSPGLDDPDLNELIHAIYKWRFTNGTYITTIEKMKEVVDLAQWYLYYLNPYIPLYSRNYINMFKPGLKCWAESNGYGSDNTQTYWWLHWEDLEVTSVNYQCGGPIDTLSYPYYTSAYEAQVLGVIYEGLRDVNPFTHEDVMWIMKDYVIEPYTATNVPYGTNLTIWIRGCVTWQDGEAFTVDDAIFAFDWINETQPRNFATVQTTYLGAQKHGDYCMSIQYNGTGLWNAYSYMAAASALPPQIWGNTTLVGDPTTFEPWNTPHPYDENLTCCMGTGPYIFVEYDEIAGVVHVTANRDYWAKDFVREDLNMDGIVDLFDAVTLSGSAGATPEHPRWTYGVADITCDYLVDIFDAVRLSGKAGTITLCP